MDRLFDGRNNPSLVVSPGARFRGASYLLYYTLRRRFTLEPWPFISSKTVLVEPWNSRSYSEIGSRLTDMYTYCSGPSRATPLKVKTWRPRAGFLKGAVVGDNATAIRLLRRVDRRPREGQTGGT